MNHPEKRSYQFRAEVGETGAGTLRGVASNVGVMDSYRSVILPGAFDAAIPDFLKSGHVCFNHEWGTWIGYPTEARMQGRSLVVEGAFYEDEKSQDIRQKIATRQKNGLETDFSITFWPDYESVEYFQSGAQLWDRCAGMGVNMAQMDPSIRSEEGFCWIIPKVKEIGEWGPVMAGATPGAGATSVRGLNDLRDPSLADATLETHLEVVLAAAQGALARFEAYAETRANDNRPVSRERLNQLEALAGCLTEMVARCKAGDPRLNKLRMEMDAVLAGL